MSETTITNGTIIPPKRALDVYVGLWEIDGAWQVYQFFGHSADELQDQMETYIFNLNKKPANRIVLVRVSLEPPTQYEDF